MGTKLATMEHFLRDQQRRQREEYENAIQQAHQIRERGQAEIRHIVIYTITRMNDIVHNFEQQCRYLRDR